MKQTPTVFVLNIFLKYIFITFAIDFITNQNRFYYLSDLKAKIIFFLFSLIATSIAFAQKEATKEADLAFSGGQYTAAIELYRKAYTETNKKSLKAEINYKIAECFRLANNNKQTEIWYQRTIESGYRDPIAILQFSLALQRNENYIKAKEYFQKYQLKNQKDIPSVRD